MYRSTVTEHFEHYIRPQENMAHTDTRMVTVADVGGHGLTVTGSGERKTFSFNCSHFTPGMLFEAKYDYELTPLDNTVVHIDYRHSGIGSGSCGPQLAEDLKLKESRFAFSFRVFSLFE
jgi:beta-galactosidase